MDEEDRASPGMGVVFHTNPGPKKRLLYTGRCLKCVMNKGV